MSEITARDRFRGCLLGLAVGDALGTTLEFNAPGTFEPIDDMVGGGPFNLQPGQWTDDTSMALCLATSLIEQGGFHATDQMQRYVRWWREGYLSSTGRCFDIGNTVKSALSRFERDGDPDAGSTDPNSAGNGSLMRLAPVAMYFAADTEEAVGMAADSSMTTHGAREAVDACRYFATLLVGALEGTEKETLLNPNYWPVWWDEEPEPLTEAIERIAGGSFKDRNPPDIKGTGYVVDALEAALWAFHRSEDFREGALLAVNLGDDADTTGAIYGQIAGAYYGVESIPVKWRERLAMAAEITSLADSLHDHAQEHMPPELPPLLASTSEETVEVAGIKARLVSIIVSGHTVQQALYYDIAEAEAVHGRPMDRALGREIQMAMFAVDRIWMDETIHTVASASALPLGGLCIRAVTINHCREIEPASASWVFTRPDGTEEEREPWSCAPDTPPISHVELIAGHELIYEGVPTYVDVAHEQELGIDRYMRNWTDAVRRAMGLPTPERPGHEERTVETIITTVRYVTRPSGERDPVDTEGWRITRGGRRDRRYTKPIGPPLDSEERGTDGTIERVR